MEQDSSHKQSKSKFIDSKSAFLRSANEHGIQIEIHLETFHSPNEYLLQLQRYGIKIIVAFVPQSEAVQMARLCLDFHRYQQI